MDLRQQIADSPMGAFQWMVVILTFALNMLDGFDVLAIAFTAKSIQEELALSQWQVGLLMSAGVFGMAVGSFVLSPLADKFGRRPLLLFATAVSACGMLMTYFAATPEAIRLWRFVTGIGVGGILPCTNVIVSEYANRKWRGLAIAIYASGFGIGAMLGGMSAVLLQNEYGWRSVFLVGALLTGLALLVMVLLLPESVDYLMSKNPSQAEKRLQVLAGKLGFHGQWQPAQQMRNYRSGALTDLLSPTYRRNTLLIWIAFIAVSGSYYFITSWTPALLEAAGMLKEQSQSVGMAISVGGAVGSLLFGFFVSRFSARGMLIAFTVLSALAVAAFVYSQTLTLSIVLAVVVGSLVNACIAGLYTINPTLYAPEFRSTGVGLAIGIGRIGAILSPAVAGKLLDSGWKQDELYLCTVGVLLLATTAVTFLQPKN